MRLVYRYMVILCLFFIVPDTLRADGEDVLERMISLPKMKGTVYSLLGNISQQSGYLFIYDSKVVDNDVTVKIRKGERTIRQAIYEITGDTSLEFKVIGTHILITSSSPTKQQQAKPSSVHLVNLMLTGTLLDKETGMPVASASVGVRRTSVGIVTNQEGEFRLSLPDSLQNDSVVFSHIGYVSQTLEVSVLAGRHHILSLEPKVVPLQEVVVQWVDPYKLLKEMGRQREQNYSHSPAYLTTFYREGVLLKNKVQNLTEAVFKVYKIASHSPVSDQAKLLKMSRLSNVEAKDSLLVKVKSGIQACFQMDIMKDMPSFLIPDAGDNGYLYTSQGVTFIDDRCVNVIHFAQKKEIIEPLYCGDLYIDAETNALLQARFEVDPQRVKKASEMFVERRTRGIRIIPQKVVYTISYKPWQGIYYIHHIRGDLSFNVKRRRLLSASPQMQIWFEMITCKVDTEQVTAFPRAERLPTRTIFSDLNFKYDEDFWRDFNVIPLEEKLGKLIERISLKIEEIGP